MTAIFLLSAPRKLHDYTKAIVVLVFCLFGTCLLGQPSVPPYILYRPTFLTRDFSHTGGLSFVMRIPESDNAYLISTHRVFGPAGGFDHQLSGADVARVFVAAAGVSVCDPMVAIIAKPSLEVSHAAVATANEAGADVSVFRLKAWGFAAALLPERGPVRRGDRVWVVVKDGQKEAVELRSATIVSLSRGEIRYWLHDQDASYAGSSGAPLVSEAGRLLGMHLDIFRTETEQRYGRASPVWEIERAAAGTEN